MWNNGRGYFPFYSTNDQESNDRHAVHNAAQTTTKTDERASRMMGGFGGYSPQWWSNYYNYWPGVEQLEQLQLDVEQTMEAFLTTATTIPKEIT
ncbi:hypothetical protein BaRGS_00020510 [Batillaria attramentaria]|uniref:Uncharacterized protein n=1 Tax=Batillaria attramentaria TaxID=370345 RepID=A0ABD0KMS9_9CAEN